MNGLIRPGDSYSTPGAGVSGWVAYNGAITPSGHHTKRYHFGIIGDYVYDINGNFIDFETRESLYKGPSCARFFSRYMGGDIEIYRTPDTSAELDLLAVRATSEIGTAFYGYIDFLKLGLDVGDNIIHGKLPPYTSQQLKYSADSDYICTEEVAYAKRKIGKPIEPPGQENIWDIPTVYLQALEEGRLIMIYKGDLKDIYESLIGS